MKRSIIRPLFVIILIVHCDLVNEDLQIAVFFCNLVASPRCNSEVDQCNHRSHRACYSSREHVLQRHQSSLVTANVIPLINQSTHIYTAP